MPIIQACIVGRLALIGIVLTQSWTTRRDYAKRRLDLASEVLALFYEVDDAIRFIRSPAQPGDGSTRQRRDGENAKEAAALDRAYIFDERRAKRESSFVALKAKRFLFIATFRGESHKPFATIDQVMHKLYMASNHLGQIYWQMRAELPMPTSLFATPGQFDTFLKSTQDLEAVFCDMGGPADPINPIVAEAVRAVEVIADKAAREYAGGFH
jgi:hypothetical protein